MLIYRIFSVLLFPFFELYLFFRVYKKKEDKKRLKERFGYSTQNRPEYDVIWLHAVSVGETNSSLVLVEELLKFSPQASILFTTTTLTSAAIISAKLPQFQGRVIHQFLPIDSYFCVKNFLEFWQPKVAIFVESEIWPNLIFEAQKMGTKTFLVNARMSEKSVKRWLIAKKFGFKIFDYFSTIFSQSLEDQKRFSLLSKKEILFYGNLKSQAQVLAFDDNELKKLKSQIGKRKLWLAASTHKGEEEIILRTHLHLKKEFPDLITIIVVRHPSRGDEVSQILNGLNFERRSQNKNISNTTEIYLVDSLGELGIFYSIAPFAFIGGSLVAVGGHNPFEAIKLNCAVISGSQVFNFIEIYRDLSNEKLCVIIADEQELIVQVREFLNDDMAVKVFSDKALSFIKKNNDITQRIVEKILI
jgi:3-deoxy-D-manno-octulosonic-acid transferase